MDYPLLLNQIILCKRDAMEKGRESEFYKKLSNHLLITTLFQDTEPTKNRKADCPINTTALFTDFSALSHHVQELDETCQELLYQKRSLQKQNEKQQERMNEQQKRSVCLILLHRNCVSRRGKSFSFAEN